MTRDRPIDFFEAGYNAGAAVAFGLMGMAEAIRRDPRWQPTAGEHRACGGTYRRFTEHGFAASFRCDGFGHVARYKHGPLP